MFKLLDWGRQAITGWSLISLLGLLLAVWIWGGMVLLTEKTPNEELERYINQLESVSPEAAAGLARLQETRAARAILPAVEAHNEDISTLRAWAEEVRTRTPFEAELVELADEAQMLRNPEELEGFLYTHALACETLTAAGDEAVQTYLDLLRQAHRRPEVWRVVRDDPVGLILWPHIGDDPELWQFYEQERDWLAEAIAFLAPAVDGVDDEDRERVDAASAEEIFVEAVEAAHRHHPLTKQAVTDLDLGALGFGLFLSHGPLIDRAVNTHDMPLEETLEVLFVNGERFEPEPDAPPDRRGRVDEDAGKLAYVWRNKPHVWMYARHFPLVLQLNHDVPQHAELLLEHYAEDDIAALLYQYEEALPQAARAVARLHEEGQGDVAIYMLARHAEDDRMVQFLNDEDIGIRLIMFLVVKGADAGLTQLEEEPSLARKDIGDDGMPREPGWWEAIPGGAIAVVVRNNLNGYPSEWGEIGWAALDVSTVVMAPLAIGTAGGRGVIQGGRVVTRSGARQAVVRGARSAAAASGRGSRLGRRQKIRSGARATPLRRLAGGAAELTERTLLLGPRTLTKPTGALWNQGRRLRKAWTRLDPRSRRWTYRAVLGVNVFVTLHGRTLPALRDAELGTKLGETVGQFLNGTLEATGAGLAAAMQEVLGVRQGTVIARLLYFGVALLLGMALLWAMVRRLRHPRLIYTAQGG